MCIKPRVLVVDDDAVIATTTSLILNGTGFESVAAFSGVQALDIARAQTFHMLVTDVIMHPMNGIELAVEFLEIHPTAQVLLITGTFDAARVALEELPRGREFPVLQKPLYPGDLIERLRAVLMPNTL
jgi:DNA-binding NtrC family response regulator